MMIKHFSITAAVLAVALSASAQYAITYVDATNNAAGRNGNTTLTNGAAWTPSTSSQGTSNDGVWARRAFANGATIYQNAGVGNVDNANRVVTTVTNVPPGTYEIYAYMWADSTPGGWRMEAALTNNASDELPL